MNAFESYAKAAATHVSNPKPLLGIIKTRAEARVIYADIASEIQACEDQDTLDAYLASIAPTLTQFQSEIDFLWEGDGEGFAGLQGEIAFAQQQFRDGPESLASNGYYEKGTGQ